MTDYAIELNGVCKSYPFFELQNIALQLQRGTIMALAILDADAKLLYSQKNGEWESTRSLDPDEIMRLLDKWKP